MAFYASEFTFDGESSAMYGLVICTFNRRGQDNVSFGNKAEIIETRTNRRIQPIHFGVNYNAAPLQFKVVFGAEKKMDRYDLEAVSFWLTGHQQYKWLTIDQPDMDNYAFRCLISELTPIAYGGYPLAFEATVLCDCPYAYSFPFHQEYIVNGSRTVLFRNQSTVRELIKPELIFAPATGGGSLSIVNHDDGDREFYLSALPTQTAIVHADNLNGILYGENSSYNYYDGFNMRFFRLVHGDNHLTITGNGTLTITGRFLQNVAG